MSGSRIAFRKLNKALKSKHLDAPKKDGTPIDLIENNLKNDKDSLLSNVQREMSLLNVSSNNLEDGPKGFVDFVDTEQICNKDTDSEHQDDESSEEENVKDIKKKERRAKSETKIINNKAYSEAEDAQIYLFVFNQLAKGIAKDRLKLSSFETWEKLRESSGINQTAPSLKQRWSNHLRSLERLVELDEVPEIVKADLRKVFGA